MKLITIILSLFIFSYSQSQSLWDSNYPVYTKDLSIEDSLVRQLLKLQFNRETQGKINTFPCNAKNKKLSILAKIVVPELSQKNSRTFDLYLLKAKNKQNDSNIFYTSEKYSHQFIDCYLYNPNLKKLKSIQAFTTDMTDNQIGIEFLEDKSTQDSLIINLNNISIDETGHFNNEYRTPASYSVFKLLEDTCSFCGSYLIDSNGISIKLIIKSRDNNNSFAYEYSIFSENICGVTQLNLNAKFVDNEFQIDSFTTLIHLNSEFTIHLDNYKLDCDGVLNGKYILRKLE